MKRKNAAALPLAILLLLSSIFSGYSSAGMVPRDDTPAAAEERPAKTPAAGPVAAEAQTAASLPRVRRIGGAADASRAGGAGAFQVQLDVAPEEIARAFLVYELAGVPHWTAAVRSINGLPAQGGFAAIPSSGTALQIEEINPRWLRAGVNRILFSPAPGGETAPSGVANLRQQEGFAADGDLPYTVRNLRLVYLDAAGSPAARLRISHPLDGESGAQGTVLRGFVEPAGLPTGPAELFVNGVHVAGGVGQADGAFAVFVPRSGREGEPWEIEVEVVYPDGTRLQRTVRLTGKTGPDDDADEDSADLDADAATAKSLSLGKARLDVAAGALAGKVKLSMRRLGHDDLPALDGGMTNVTPLRGGFRMGPHGLRFRKPVRLSLPFDAALIPRGMTLEDVQTFFFDEEAGRWFPLPRAAAKAGGDVIVSLTDHFTDFINATLALPDEPSGANFSPNSLQELAKADPAAGIVQIEPPEGGPTGDAALDFPLVVPAGRRGLQPDLAVQYNSSGGDGWLGMGWDLRLPSIEISTLFGVPRYDGSERYLIDGEQLAPSGEPGRFVRRIEGSFERIVRLGNGPADYSWEVTDQDGTRYLYGRTAQARLSDRENGNVFRWYLERVVDLHGNTIEYSYFRDEGGGGSDGEPWVEVYPEAITYSGGFYQVHFVLDDGKQRHDRLSSGRPGFKTYTRRLLASVDVRAGGSLVRRYEFEYREGDFRKSLLDSIMVRGEDGETEFYHHNFSYFSPSDPEQKGLGFGEPVSWGTLSDTDSQSETFNVAAGAHGFVGIGDESCSNHGGIQVGGGGGGTENRAIFLDVNGDGLTDRLGNSKVALSHYDPIQGRGRFADTQDFSGADLFGRTLDWSFDLGAGGHLLNDLIVADASWVWSHNNDDHAVADVNGDGRPDLVGSGKVRFNDGSGFSEEGAWMGGGGSQPVPGEEDQILSEFKLSDALRKLVLPFNGTVTIAGGAVLKPPQSAEDGDGVRLEIYHYRLTGHRLWRHTIAPGDSPCVPAAENGCGAGLTKLAVERGDRLYFLANSIRSTASDALLWAPRVTYSSLALAPGVQKELTPDELDQRESYGPKVFVFDAGEDFRIAGYRDPGWTAPAGGRVRILGSFDKQATPAGVEIAVEVQKKGALFPLPFIPPFIPLCLSFAKESAGSFVVAPPKEPLPLLACQPFSADQAGPLTIAVEEGDVIRFHVRSGSPLDPRLVRWTPTVTYEGGEYCRKPLDGSAPICGAPSCHANPSSGRTECTVAGDSEAVAIPLETITQAPPEWTDVFPAFWSQPGEVLSGGYHGWFYGEWNGNAPFDENGLRKPKSKHDHPLYVAARPRWEGVTNVSGPVWEAAGFDLYLAAEGVKPSRQGMDAAGELGRANGGSAGPAMVRKTTGNTVGLQANVSGVGLSLSCGASETQLDLLDMNGDLYPDQVTGNADPAMPDGVCWVEGGGGKGAGGVRFSDGRGGFGAAAAVQGFGSPVRRTADANVSTSIGLGINFSRKDGKGSSKAVANTMPSVGSTLTLSQTTTDLVDVNGDGLPDRVSMTPDSSAVKVQLNLGYRFGAEERWYLPPWQNGSVPCADAITTISSSIAESLSPLDTLNTLRHSRSSAVNAGAVVGPIGGGVGTSVSRTLVDLVDVNGDGLPDHVARDDGGAFRAKLNLGDGWGAEQTWHDPDWGPRSRLGNPVLPSLLTCLDAISSSENVDQNGSGGAPICIPLTGFGIRIEISAQGSHADGEMRLSLEDFDGDGLADRVLKGSDSTVYVKSNLAGKANLLKGVERPLGGTIALDYRRQGNRVGAEDGRKIDMPSSQWVLAATVVDDGRDHEYRTEYEYFNDAFYDRAERESYGYARVQATLPDGSTVDRTFHNQDFYSRHLMTKEVVADAAGNLFRVATARYEERPVVGASRFPALVEETTSFYEGLSHSEGSPPKSTGKTYEYDNLGNVVRTTDRADTGIEDDVNVAIAYRFDDSTGLTRPASIEVRDGAGRLLRRRVGTYDERGDLVRLEQTLAGGRDPQTGSPYDGSRNAVSSFSYDGIGNLVSAVDPTGYTSNFAYDASTRTYPVEVRDSFGYVTRYAWDLKHGSPTETIDENGNSIRSAYDGFGRRVRVVGPYDSDAAPTLAFEYGHAARPAWSVVHHKDATRSDSIDSAVFIDGLERMLQTKEDAELDLGFGTSTRAGMRVSGLIEFDKKGRIASASQPVFDDGPANRFVDVPAKNPTAFAYDVLNRVREVRFPHGAVTRVDYGFGSLDGSDRFLTVRTDPNGRATRFYRDVDDNVLGVEQVNTIGGSRKTLVTRYAYDALSELTSVTDARGNATRLEYDTLGRNVVLNNPDLGRTEYRFDPAGNLGARITANLAALGQQIRYLYTFNRLDRVDYPQSPDVAFTYGGPGAPLNRANRIITVTDASGVEERSYGKLGEVVQTVKTAAALNGNTPKGPYTTRLQFDSFNRLLSVVYPDGETLSYGYDAGGQVKSAAGVLRGAGFDYLRHMGYDEFGERARVVFGNGVETRYAYDPQSRLLTQLRTTGAGRDLQNLRYQYDPTGTVLAIQNDVPVPPPPLYGGPASQTFRYDDLYQLVAADGIYRGPPNKQSTYSLSLAYDETGNVTAKNQLHQIASGGGKPNPEKKTSYNWAYTYGGPQPHAPTRIGDRTFRYDRDGNQTGWDTDKNGTRRTLTWNEENRLSSVADNGQTTRFLYGANGMRTNKAGQHSETIYVNRWFSIRSGAIASKHVYADDVRLSTKVSPNPNPPSEKVYFYQADHLGSAQFITDDLGTVYQHLEYFPSGETWVDERSETQRTPYLFSGKELDEETGLSYFGFRYYDARQGQWISADPILDGMLDLEALQIPDLTPGGFQLQGIAYGYVGNNPANLVDPNGLVRTGPWWTFFSNPSTTVTTAARIWTRWYTTSTDSRFLRLMQLKATLSKYDLRYTTLALTDTVQGKWIISSSKPKLPPQVLKLLDPVKEVAATGKPGKKGQGTTHHAEQKGMTTAEQLNLTPTESGATNLVCPECEDVGKKKGVGFFTPTKRAKEAASKNATQRSKASNTRRSKTNKSSGKVSAVSGASRHGAWSFIGQDSRIAAHKPAATLNTRATRTARAERSIRWPAAVVRHGGPRSWCEAA